MQYVGLLIVSMLASLAWAGFAGAEEVDPREIMQRVYDRDDGDTLSFDAEMLLIDAEGQERRRSFRGRRRDVGEDSQRLFSFEAPADVEGTGFLVYDYDDSDQDDDQWLYLPALRRVKRIAGSEQSGSFVGSDFSFADFTEPPIEKYDYALLKEDEVRGSPVWVIQSVPKDDDEIERTGYTKSVVFVRKDADFIVRAIYWVGTTNKLKYYDVPVLDQIDGIWTARVVEMALKSQGRTLHRTILENKNIRYNEALGDRMFSVRALERSDG